MQSGARKGKDFFLTGSLIAPSPAYGNRPMLARGDFFNNMKAPRVVSACQPYVDFDHLIL